MGFGELAVNGHPDLWGAVLERVAVLAAFVTLHLLVARRAGEHLEYKRRHLPRPDRVVNGV